MDERKNVLLKDAQTHIEQVGSDISEYQGFIQSSIQTLREKLQKGGLEDPEVIITIIIHRLETKQQLEYASKSPYFVRCDVKFDDENETKTLYFGRFPFTKNDIYSWVAPAASIRFESPGKLSYSLPNGEQRTGTLLRKDQFMIVDRKIVFMSTESVNVPRDLVYQEYFSERKAGFVLPEIVEQMEKAQDKIIRSHYKGSFLISGAAGSGKTTLALHRVAYLAQSPETEKLFQPNDIIVFVQDASTKKYFSSLLPELGIYRVKIVTFDEWAINILGINNMQFVRRYGTTEEEKDLYEFKKNEALHALKNLKAGSNNIFVILEEAYRSFFSAEQNKLFKQQLHENYIDRFDITILLSYFLRTKGTLIETVKKYVLQKSSRKYIKKVIKQPIQYSLIVLDEAENYLAEQINIIKTCINPTTNAIIYVGDLAQQTLLWTIKDWNYVNEQFADERQVVLHKVYRNTKQILAYISSAGYNVTIPEKLKEGQEVTEHIVQGKDEEIAFVTQFTQRHEDLTIGVLAKTDEYLTDYKKGLSSYKNVHILTINEAQGVEFDTVFLVGINKEFYDVGGFSEEVKKERQRVNHDLLYVALTRAMNRLYVVGELTIKELLQNT